VQFFAVVYLVHTRYSQGEKSIVLERKHHIYKLFFEEKPDTLYIGKTYDLNKRLAQHLSYSSLSRPGLKNNWLNVGMDNGWTPKIEAIESDISSSSVNAREIYWILYYRSLPNITLKNSTDGGDGGLGRVPDWESRKRMAAAQTGRRHTQETLVKMSKSSKNHLDYRVNQTRAQNSRRVWSEDSKTKMRLSKLNPSVETRDKLSKSKAKYSYTIISPEGVEYKTISLTRFSKEVLGVNATLLRRVAIGEKEDYKGWKVNREIVSGRKEYV
jgi:hypothetical protein